MSSFDSALLKLTVLEIHNGLRKKEFSVHELFETYKQHIERYNAKSNALLCDTFDYAEKKIELLQQKINQGQEWNLLDGIPLIVKDMFCTKGMVTTGAATMLENFVPSYTATVVESLENEGMILLGKANCDQFGMGSANQNSHFGEVQNPWIRDDGGRIIPGGSSGGSAVAVASYCTPVSLGTDTGGSVRQPSACCGIVGLRPTYGMCSRFGVMPLASSLDTPGPFTRNVDDNAIIFDAMKGFDPKDNATLNHKPEKFFPKLQQDHDFQNLRVGIVKEFAQIDEGTVPKLHKEAVKIFDNHHIEHKEVSFGSTEYAIAAYYAICCAEAYSNMARYDGIRYGLTTQKDDTNLKDFYKKVRSEGFIDEVKLRIMMGNYLLSNKSKNFDNIYRKSTQVRKQLLHDFENAFKEVDIIITPILLNTPRLMGGTVNAVEDRYNDAFTVFPSLAGLPGLSIPLFKHDDGLPVAIQFIAKHGGEYNLFKMAKLFEQEVNFAQNMQEKIFDLCVKN